MHAAILLAPLFASAVVAVPTKQPAELVKRQEINSSDPWSAIVESMGEFTFTAALAVDDGGQCSTECQGWTDAIAPCTEKDDDEQIVRCACSESAVTPMLPCGQCLSAGTENNFVPGFQSTCVKVYEAPASASGASSSSSSAASSSQSHSSGSAASTSGASHSSDVAGASATGTTGNGTNVESQNGDNGAGSLISSGLPAVMAAAVSFGAVVLIV
ncbi:hypothetical protein Rhopal_000119-T1 [Rhodotorula paludigena]|uniref:Uncharacterized protein n=1 Tax=Rhodotorula paludigena TaxID=86838 RepID=A0AAV5G9S4_9BASI|nr:hypothetical protein Rhopal_000119-T1 [Rhodotorula paludigena]